MWKTSLRRPAVIRRLRPVWVLAAGAAFVLVAGNYFGYVRAGVAFGLSAGILWLGFSYFRSAGGAPQAPVAEIEDREIHFVCGMCGLEVKVEVMGIPKPPTHCRESMQVVTVDATRPPLKPI